jgi:hypothetical protein
MAPKIPKMKFSVYLLLLPPYLIVGYIAYLALLMGGGIQGIANVLFAIVWMALPYFLARASMNMINSPAVFPATWIILAWLFMFLLEPVAEALYYVGIDL